MADYITIFSKIPFTPPELRCKDPKIPLKANLEEYRKMGENIAGCALQEMSAGWGYGCRG